MIPSLQNFSRVATQDPILSAASDSLGRARAELRMIAAVMPLGRFGMALAARCGISIQSFTEDDTTAIFAAMTLADSDGRISDRFKTAQLIRLALDDRGLWCEEDVRSLGTGSRWGPERLANLFNAVATAEAEELLPGLAGELRRAVA